MNSALVDGVEQDRVIAAAIETFSGIGHMIEALYPLHATQPLDLARELNPAAGTHRTPSDDRELQAALRAGERSWHQFPYYAWRYGERGAQYTRSDSAWLVTLVSHAQPVVDQQIRWLGRLLAARGMPRWMLKLHLDVLYEELVTAVPEQRRIYARLQHAAHDLREERRRAISDQLIAAHVVAFDQQVGSEWSTRLPKTGGLLVAAVADEQSGVVQAVTSIEGWMTDSSRFPRHWVEAVQQTIHLARAQALVTEPA